MSDRQLSLQSWQVEKVRLGYIEGRGSSDEQSIYADNIAVLTLASIAVRELWRDRTVSGMTIVEEWAQDFHPQKAEEINNRFRGSRYAEFSWICFSNGQPGGEYDATQLLRGLETGAIHVEL